MASRPELRSTSVEKVTLLDLSSVTVSGSTPSRVVMRKVPPSRMLASFSGPCALTPNSLRRVLSFWVSNCASRPSESANTCARVIGVVALPSATTLLFPRKGPLFVVGRKSRYCSPAGDKPDTRTSLSTGSFTEPLIAAIATTPPLSRLTDSTRPIGTPRRVTSWLGSNPPDSWSCTFTWYSDSIGFTFNVPNIT
ncbi:Uncharacterised protein [Mycobacteroides abscessus subsp. abscessus]|nr:Uncharacterised protein [Mycobacteroides abscessus subsp. abscessus]